MIWILLPVHSICQITVQINIYIYIFCIWNYIIHRTQSTCIWIFNTIKTFFFKFQWLFPVILIESHVNDVMNGLISSVNVVLKSVAWTWIFVCYWCFSDFRTNRKPEGDRGPPHSDLQRRWRFHKCGQFSKWLFPRQLM